jgi:chromate transport protein ChrA
MSPVPAVIASAGVAAVGVALVASAAKGMASKLCATPLLSIICTLAAVVAYYWPKAYTFPALIAAGGLLTLGWSYYKKQTPPPVKVIVAVGSVVETVMLGCGSLWASSVRTADATTSP